MKYYSFNMGDYAEKAAHLTWDEDAAYRKLLDWYYSLEGPLPTDTRAIYRKMKADTEDRRAACDAVLAEFFTLTAQGFSHEKCDARIAKFYNVSKSASDRGKAGAEIKKAKAKLKEAETKLQLDKDKQPITHNPIPITHVVARESFQVLEAALLTIAELANQPVKTNPDVSPIFKLVQRGFDVQTEIIPIIRNRARTARPGSIRSWGYFVASIEDGRSERSNSNGHSPYVTNEVDWNQRLETARKMKSWDKKWGPMPNEDCCLVPVSFLRPNDGVNWVFWEPTR